jgi:hypothetical protein
MNQKQQSGHRVALNFSVFAAGIIAVALTVAGPTAADASTFSVPSMAELTDLSSAVIRGRVTSSDCRRLTGSGRIVTDYQVEVIEIIADYTDDRTDRTVRITFPGGTVGNDGEVVTGVPVYQTGDEVVLFLKRPGTGATADRSFFHVTGMAVGAFRIDRTVADRPIVHGYVQQEVKARSSGTAEPDSLDLQSLINAVRARTVKSSANQGVK